MPQFHTENIFTTANSHCNALLSKNFSRSNNFKTALHSSAKIEQANYFTSALTSYAQFHIENKFTMANSHYNALLSLHPAYQLIHYCIALFRCKFSSQLISQLLWKFSADSLDRKIFTTVNSQYNAMLAENFNRSHN